MGNDLSARFTCIRRANCGRSAALWLVWLGFGCATEPMSDELAADTSPTMAMVGTGATGAANTAGQRPDSAQGVAGRPGTAGPGPATSAGQAAAGAAAQSGGAVPASGPAAANMTTVAGNMAAAAGGTTAAAGSSGSMTGAAGSTAAAGSNASTSGSAGMAAAAGAAGNGNMTGAAGSGGKTSADTPLRVYIASDSTASNYKDTGSDNDQAGWGQMLPEFVKPFAKVDNRAIGGRTARRFIDEGRLDEIWADIKPGDYLLVQFGTNDGNKNASYEINGQTIPYYLDPATDFKTYVRRYIAGAKERGAVPVLVTPPPRNSAYCTGGNGTNAHAQALRELGDSDQVGVVDLNKKTVTYLQAICPEPSPPDFFLQKPDGSVDGTHFQERGARELASFVAEGLEALTVTWVKE